MHDVLIVGGGPVGCLTAGILADAGFDVLVAEEHAEIGHPTDCSGILGVEAFERFPLPRDVIVGGLQKALLVSPGGVQLEFVLERPIAFILDRARFDQGLAAQATRHGAKFHLGSRISRVVLADGGVKAWINGGEERTAIEAKTLVLANGVHYRFQQQLGMGRPPEFVTTAQVDFEATPSDSVEVYFGSEYGRGSFGWYVPYRHGRRSMVRVGLLAARDATLGLRSYLQRSEVAERLRGMISRVRGSIIPIRPLSRTYRSRVLAVGDAAGLAKPTTGGGIFYGLISAELAAETIVRAFQRGDFSKPMFARYEERWRQELNHELRMGRVFRRLASGLTDPEVDSIFRLASMNGLMPRLSRQLSFDWHQDAILTLLKKPSVLSIFVRGLFR